MFVSLPEFEITDPAVSVSSAARFWRGIGFTGAKPWLIATLEVPADSETLVEAVCLWDENDLVPLIDIDPPHGRLASLQRVRPIAQGGVPSWRLDTVTEIWVGQALGANSRGRDEDESEPHVLLYRFSNSGPGLQTLASPFTNGLRKQRLLKSFVGE